MKRMVGPIVLSLGVTTLAACGGGGGGGNGSLSADARQYNSLVNEYNGYVRKYKLDETTLAEINRTPLNQMPVSAKANYSGVGVIETINFPENRALGKARLTADFGRSTITGSVTNFKTNAGKATSGRLNVKSTIRDNLILGRTTGSISLNGKTHSIDQLNAGVFSGNKAKTVFISSTDKTSRLDVDSIDTSIVAERD